MRSSPVAMTATVGVRSEEHTSELQSQSNLVCRLLLEKKKKKKTRTADGSRERGKCWHCGHARSDLDRGARSSHTMGHSVDSAGREQPYLRHSGSSRAL